MPPASRRGAPYQADASRFWTCSCGVRRLQYARHALRECRTAGKRLRSGQSSACIPSAATLTSRSPAGRPAVAVLTTKRGLKRGDSGQGNPALTGVEESEMMPIVQNHLSILQVCKLFDFDCLFANTEAASGYWIGNRVESLPGMTVAAVTPVFETRERLDNFCSEHIGEFRNFAARGRVPSRLWERPSTELKHVHSRGRMPDL